MGKENAPQAAWIIVADRANMERCAKHGVFGLNAKAMLEKMRPGERLVAYLRGEKVFGGLGSITEPYYLDDKPLFEGGLYPDRIGIKLELLPKERSLDVWSVIDELDFASNKVNWWASLVGGVRRIPVSDYEKIAARFGQAIRR